MTTEQYMMEHGADDMKTYSGPYGEACDCCGLELDCGDSGFWVKREDGETVAVHRECLFEWFCDHMEPEKLAFAMGLESWRCQ